MSELEEFSIEKEDHKLSEEEQTLENNSEIDNENRNDIFFGDYFEVRSHEYELDNKSITENENWENNAEWDTECYKSESSELTTIKPQTRSNKNIDNDLIVLEPNNPIMARFQNTLKQHLIKQRDTLKKEVLTLDGVIKSKQNEKSTFVKEIDGVLDRIENQNRLISEFHRMQQESEKAKEQVNTCIKQGKQRYNEIITKTTTETKKISDLRRQLDCCRGLLDELLKHEKEQESSISICNQKKSQTKLYKKKLLSEQQRMNLLLLSLSQENLRLEDRMKQLGEQAEKKYNESELLKQKMMDCSTDLDAINEENAKMSLLWSDVLLCIQQRDKLFQNVKKDFQNAKSRYQVLLTEANSYERSSQEEIQKNEELNFTKNQLIREYSYLKDITKTNIEKRTILQNKCYDIVKITEVQQNNLNIVLLEQKSLKNESNRLLDLLEKKSKQKSKYEEEIQNEFKKKLFANNTCSQINNKILELKNQNKEHELSLVVAEKNLSDALLKLEQNRTTCYNLEKYLDKNNKKLNEQKLALSTLNGSLKNLIYDIQAKSRQIDGENKQLENLMKKHEEGHIMTPQIKIDQVRFLIDEVEKEIDNITQSWVQKQYTNSQLLDQHNKQTTEYSKLSKFALVMDIKNRQQKLEINNLCKETEQYKLALINLRNEMMKSNEKFNKNKGKNSQLLNENEWIQWSYLNDLKENEKQYLEYIDRVNSLKNELIEMKNLFIEKQRECKSWESKVQYLTEMKKEMKNKEGDSGDIDNIRHELHKMQAREGQLKKMLEKIMFDLELCLSKREVIYNKVAVRDLRSKGKNEIKQKVLKTMEDLRKNIKKIKTECKKLDRTISDVKHDKMELENKLAHLNETMIQVQNDIDQFTKIIDEIAAKKNKNIHILSYKQKHATFLDEVVSEKYHLIIKSESKMHEELEAEKKTNSDLISIVESLKNDFPYLDAQITRLLNILNALDQ